MNGSRIAGIRRKNGFAMALHYFAAVPVPLPTPSTYPVCSFLNTLISCLSRWCRTTHPTKAIPRLKQFKVQEARLARQARNNRAPSTATITPTTHRLELSRPLGQPVHSLEDEQRGIGGKDGQSFGGGHDEGSDVRRGRRSRKQMHPSLSEDMISASFGGVDDKDYGIGRNEGCDSGDSGGDDAPLRFRRSGDAPWGSGDKPLIKVSGNRPGAGSGAVFVLPRSSSPAVGAVVQYLIHGVVVWRVDL